MPVHQYWTDELEWPVIQHGQGIVTINQTEEKYTWNDFKKLILETIDFLKSSYENEITINRISLEYVDAFDMSDFESLSFIENNLQTSIKTKYDLPGKLTNIKINRNYIQDDGTYLNINITDAVNNSTNKDAVVMITSAIKEIADLNNNFENNLEVLHNVCSEVFKAILDKDYYGSFN
ncbi:TIGR04255 family protein [Flavobacterium sp. ZS1P14]|uniref:TIGR04255 family protein n=1 Tax=Flavobacterium sp. ZS1P14 TaxID=3401729 RepID=UPI003AABCA65